MNPLDYLYPKDTAEQIIIGIQILLFIFWLSLVIWQILFLQKTSREIESCDSISNFANENSTLPVNNESAAVSRFQEYCNQIGLPEKSFIYSHLKTLYRAGFFQSHLDIQALIKNTAANISSLNQTLRSILSLFIVLGLLGTLYGLATSLRHLPTNLAAFSSSGAKAVANNGLASEAFGQMLERLGSAFTPSLTGVFITILGVLIITFVQKHTNTINLLMEKETLSNWILYLYPTTPQHLSDQLKRSEQQLKENFDAAQKVAEFAGNIRSEAEGLKDEISETRVRFKDLRSASENLVKFSDVFSKSVHDLPNFQNELRELNKQMLGESELLHTTIENALKKMDAGFVEVLNTVNSKLENFLVPLQTNFNQSLEDSKGFLDGNRTFLGDVRKHFSQQSEFFNQQYSEQKEQLTTLLQSLKNYEETYISTRKTIDDTLIRTLSAVEGAGEKLGAANEAVIQGLVESIGSPLKEELTGNMKEITASMNNIPADLGSISTKLNQINIPLERAAERMSLITEKFDKRTENFVGGIKNEFETQNQQNKQYLEDLSTVNKNVSLLNSNLQSLNERLNDFNQNLNKAGNLTSRNITLERMPPKISGNGKVEPEKSFYQKVINYFRRNNG